MFRNRSTRRSQACASTFYHSRCRFKLTKKCEGNTIWLASSEIRFSSPREIPGALSHLDGAHFCVYKHDRETDEHQHMNKKGLTTDQSAAGRRTLDMAAGSVVDIRIILSAVVIAWDSCKNFQGRHLYVFPSSGARSMRIKNRRRIQSAKHPKRAAASTPQAISSRSSESTRHTP